MLDLPVAATREKQRFAEEGRGPLETGFSSTVRRQRSVVGPSAREREREIWGTLLASPQCRGASECSLVPFPSLCLAPSAGSP